MSASAKPNQSPDPNAVALEEGLDALLRNVRRYTDQGRAVPPRVAHAFNRLCDVLDKPDAAPWSRIR